MVQQLTGFTPLTQEEQRHIDGGFVCGGLCVGILFTVGALAGGALVTGMVNGYNNAGNGG